MISCSDNWPSPNVCRTNDCLSAEWRCYIVYEMKLKPTETLHIAFNNNNYVAIKMTGVKSEKMKWFVPEHIPHLGLLSERVPPLYIQRQFAMPCTTLGWNASQLRWGTYASQAVAQVQFHSSYLQCTLRKHAKGMRTIAVDSRELAFILWALNKEPLIPNFVNLVNMTKNCLKFVQLLIQRIFTVVSCQIKGLIKISWATC